MLMYWNWTWTVYCCLYSCMLHRDFLDKYIVHETGIYTIETSVNPSMCIKILREACT